MTSGLSASIGASADVKKPPPVPAVRHKGASRVKNTEQRISSAKRTSCCGLFFVFTFACLLHELVPFDGPRQFLPST